MRSIANAPYQLHLASGEMSYIDAPYPQDFDLTMRDEEDLNYGNSISIVY